MSRSGSVIIELNAVIAAIHQGTPRILTVPHQERVAKSGWNRSIPPDSLPFGPLEPATDRTLELGLRKWVREQTGIELGYVEQLYTFGDRDRDPGDTGGGSRVISVPYLALVKEVLLPPETGARWCNWYEYFPWENWLLGAPPVLHREIVPSLLEWSVGTEPLALRRRERVEIAFGLGGSPWDEERVLERYELLYEARLVAERQRDAELAQGRTRPAAHRLTLKRSPSLSQGRPMALDHRRILATALGRLRGKIKYRPVVFELLAPTFTLLELQRVVEALSGVGLHKQNFRRLVVKGGLVEETGETRAKTGGRPAKLFRFRREVLRERPAPGVSLPGASSLAP